MFDWSCIPSGKIIVQWKNSDAVRFYPGHGRGVGEDHQEYRGVEEKLEIIREIPSPGCTHLTLSPEVVDVQQVPPPVLGAVGGVLHWTEWPSKED